MEVGCGGLPYYEELASNLRPWWGVDEVWKKLWLLILNNWLRLHKDYPTGVWFGKKPFWITMITPNEICNETQNNLPPCSEHLHFLDFLAPYARGLSKQLFLRKLIRLLVVKISKYWWNYQNYNDPFPQIDLLKSSVKYQLIYKIINSLKKTND